MDKIKDLEQKTETIPTYVPEGDDKILQEYVKRRKAEMKSHREALGIEKTWIEADEEYIPHELDFKSGRKRFEQDQDTGNRSRMVPVGDASQDWRSNNAAPTLLVKIQTAFAIIIDNDPEAALTAMRKMYESRTDVAKAIWKRNWQISGGKENLKKFCFNLLKYGWAVGRTMPKLIKYNKKVLTEVDSDDPANNKYEDKEIVWYNDVGRTNLDVYNTWIDEQSKPYDQYSTNDCYYEMDFSYDTAEIEFGSYENWKYVARDSKVTNRPEQSGNASSAGIIDDEDPKHSDRKDIVTIGFYENRVKDLYVIFVPKNGVVLHKCPLPNDDGMLSLWHTPWILRSATSPYGISLWSIIKQNKQLYDKMQNMTMDQLVLSIMKFGYYTGTSEALGDGQIKIVPGQARQIINGEVKWMEIPGPGKDAYEGRKIIKSEIDDDSGITPTIEGEVTGKTLGEIQIARESSLKRLKTPLENIAYAIEQDVYLTLSWSKQTLSTPELKEFASVEEMQKYEAEMGVTNGGLNATTDAMGQISNIQAQYYPEVALHLEDRDGQLFESNESKFFQMGQDIKSNQLDWKGIVKVIPKSLVGNSEIILQQTKMQMFNLIVPLLQAPPELMKKPIMQILKINEEEAEDWLPDSWLMPPMPIPMQQPLFTPQGGEGGTMQNQAGTGGIPQAPTVVPQGEVSGPTKQNMQGGLGKVMNKMFKP